VEFTCFRATTRAIGAGCVAPYPSTAACNGGMKCLLRQKSIWQNLGELSKGFYGLYASKGQSPIAPEGWLRALLLQALCGKAASRC